MELASEILFNVLDKSILSNSQQGLHTRWGRYGFLGDEFLILSKVGHSLNRIFASESGQGILVASAQIDRCLRISHARCLWLLLGGNLVAEEPILLLSMGGQHCCYKQWNSENIMVPFLFS